MMDFVVAAAISYLLGSIPNGLILGKAIWGVDLRQHGSGNIGATNAWRTIGKPAGILIFLLDFLKDKNALILLKKLIFTCTLRQFHLQAVSSRFPGTMFLHRNLYGTEF